MAKRPAPERIQTEYGTILLWREPGKGETAMITIDLEKLRKKDQEDATTGSETTS